MAVFLSVFFCFCNRLYSYNTPEIPVCQVFSMIFDTKISPVPGNSLSGECKFVKTHFIFVSAIEFLHFSGLFLFPGVAFCENGI